MRVDFYQLGTTLLHEVIAVLAGKVLDSGELRRVVGVRTITVDVRVLVATNRDLDGLVRAGRLREDLLHRVDVIRITLPPLRDRPEDIPRFVAHFLAQHRRRGLGEKTVTPQALRVLQGYRWPGNVRELANTIERLMILTPGPTIDVADLPENLRADPDALPADDGAFTLPAAIVDARPSDAFMLVSLQRGEVREVVLDDGEIIGVAGVAIDD